MPYRSYRTRVRRMESRVPLDEGSARFVDLQYPSISSSDVPPSKKPRWSPSPDDVFNVRDAYKWGERFWNMLKFGTQAGTDAMIPMFQDAYASFVQGYQAVEEAFKLYKSGREAYDYYRAKLKQFRDQFPDAPAPHDDPTLVPGKPMDRPDIVDVDPGVAEAYEYGQRVARRRQYYVPETRSYSASGMQTYPGKRPPGYRPHATGGSGKGSKLKLKSSRYVFD